MKLKNNISWFIVRRLLKYLSPIISLFERPKIKKYAKKKPTHSPVFIIGVPRSGSTVLYQVLTDIFDVLYFDNLFNLGREVPYFSLWLSQKIFKGKPHYSYRSVFGNTKESGLHGPSETGEFWYRWIDRNAIHIDGNDLSDAEKKEIKSVLEAMINRFDRPIVIKNLYSSLRIRLLVELFPNAKFIHIKRDYNYIAQSIYKARRSNKINAQKEWWSVPIPEFQSLLAYPVEKQIAHQICKLEEIIETDLKLVPSENVLEITYEGLTIKEIRAKLGTFLNVKEKKLIEENLFLKVENRLDLDLEIFNKLESNIREVLDK